jgi:hypothetical protein
LLFAAADRHMVASTSADFRSPRKHYVLIDPARRYICCWSEKVDEPSLDFLSVVDPPIGAWDLDSQTGIFSQSHSACTPNPGECPISASQPGLDHWQSPAIWSTVSPLAEPASLTPRAQDASLTDRLERRGFHEEILKAAEAALISENSGSRETLSSAVFSVLQARSGSGGTAPGTLAISMCMEVIPDKGGLVLSQECRRENLSLTRPKLPSLWALMMALAASDRPAWQRVCSSTALAAILLLQFAGHVNTESLLDIIRPCLQRHE